MMRAWLSLLMTFSIVAISSPGLARHPDAAGAAASASPSSKGGAQTEAASGKKKQAPAKRARARANNARLAKRNKSKGPCYARPVNVVRVRGQVVERHKLSLTRCNGAPNLRALTELSVVARPRDVDRPTNAEVRAYRARPVARGKVGKKGKRRFRNPAFVSERIMRVHRGLLVRLQRVANRYPGRDIEIISGYRPDARKTSRHHHARALDLRVAGVPRERLVDFLRRLDDTGVGYYPNSVFVHMDVREDKGFWVDRSGPGEPPDYGPWPSNGKELERDRELVLEGALAALGELNRPLFRDSTQRPAQVASSLKPARSAEPHAEGDDMSLDELQRVRAEARRALDEL